MWRPALRTVTNGATLVDLSLLRFFVKVSLALVRNRSDDGEAGMQSTRDVLHRGSGSGDGMLSSPGFPGVKHRVPGYYSLLASLRVLGPQIVASESTKNSVTHTRDEYEY